ncbi:MAG TPA: N-acetylmuramoyl-L-alanine amidase [Rhizomicrobium sp.]|nr:N-acetylmuramoyl-L-alanine amidase [Rhizomicrobium sp.]
MLLKGGAFGLAFLMAAAVAGAQPLPAVNPDHVPDNLVDSAIPPPGRSDAPSVPVVLSARVGEQPDRTRFVIELSDLLQLRVFTLTNPDRVVVDMPEVLWRLRSPDRPVGTGAVRAYRYGLFRPGDSRFVIDLNRPVAPAEPMVLPPEKGFGYRVVLDLFPTTDAKFAAAAGWPADLRNREAVAERLAEIPPPQTAAEPPPLQSKARVIVIDAGHGGIDSGTIGVDGLLEKNLVLDEALRLKKILQKRGYVVHLTRDTDIYIPLRERVNIARGYQADLFISLHADSNPDASVSGASVYTLSESGSDKEAAALARKENQSDVIAGVDLSGENSPVASILIDLAQRDTMNRSSRFAEIAVTQLSQATDILPREPHRAAAFVVLKAPDVPAVLIELGYLSNAHDCAQMGTAEWRDATALAIAAAVDRNFGQAAQPVPVASQTPE